MSTPPAHGTGQDWSPLNEGQHEAPRVQLFHDGLLDFAEEHDRGTPLRKRKLGDVKTDGPLGPGRRASEIAADERKGESSVWTLDSSQDIPEAQTRAPSLLPLQGSPERGALSAASSPRKEAHSSADPGHASFSATKSTAHAAVSADELPARGAAPGEGWAQPAAPRPHFFAAGGAVPGLEAEGHPSGAAVGPEQWDPALSLASLRHEFGEHGGVNMSIENSATFTVMSPETMAKIFKGEVGPDDDNFVYSRHYNPTVMHLGRQLAALEGTESGYCTGEKPLLRHSLLQWPGDLVDVGVLFGAISLVHDRLCKRLLWLRRCVLPCVQRVAWLPSLGLSFSSHPAETTL